MVRPSAGTSFPSGSTIRSASLTTVPTPCRDRMTIRSGASRSSQAGCHAHTAIGPYVSVSPYRCVTRMPSSSTTRRSAGDGGAPPTNTLTSRGSRAAAGSPASMVRTVGAPQRWLTSPAESMSHTFPASNRARHRCSPPIAVTAHVNAQPLQWNIGSVHRYAVRVSSRASAMTPSVCR